jgi:hypothetical protein
MWQLLHTLLLIQSGGVGSGADPKGTWQLVQSIPLDGS